MQKSDKYTNVIIVGGGIYAVIFYITGLAIMRFCNPAIPPDALMLAFTFVIGIMSGLAAHVTADIMGIKR